jgi:hypothetical protein
MGPDDSFSPGCAELIGGQIATARRYCAAIQPTRIMNAARTNIFVALFDARKQFCSIR